MKRGFGDELNVFGFIGPAAPNPVTMAVLKPVLKNSSFMLIVAHWQQKRKFHGVCVCVYVSYVGHPTMSNDPLL